MSGIFKEGEINFTLFFAKMHSFNAVVLLFVLSTLIGVIYTQDGYHQLPDQNSVCLCENDPYVLNVPKLLNISLNGKMEVVHSNVDKFTGIRESCNGIATADLETFQLKIEKKFKDISEENRGNISSEIATIKKEISEDKQNMEKLKEKIEDVSYVLTQIKDAIKEIRNNVSAEINEIKKEMLSGISNIMTTSTSMYIPKSCKEIYENGKRVTGVYKIQPKSMIKPFDVFCDMQTRGGGWTVIQNRFDGSQDLSWHEYKDGFGDINKEFWMGLEKIYQMTSYEKNELLVELVTKNGRQHYAQYTEFGIGPESIRYKLTTLDGYSGDSHDSFIVNKGQNFYTKHDRSPQPYRGGWWFMSSSNSNLNGPYSGETECPGTFGAFWAGVNGCISVAKSRMLIRPV